MLKDHSMQATVRLDTQHNVGPIDRRMFGGFLEHLGRAVYEGIYDPGNPLSDANGFRRDVIDVLHPLGMPIIRYPGGNFVSCYDWRDGIGSSARDARPRPATWGGDHVYHQRSSWSRPRRSDVIRHRNDLLYIGSRRPSPCGAMMECWQRDSCRTGVSSQPPTAGRK